MRCPYNEGAVEGSQEPKLRREQSVSTGTTALALPEYFCLPGLSVNAVGGCHRGATMVFLDDEAKAISLQWPFHSKYAPGKAVDSVSKADSAHIPEPHYPECSAAKVNTRTGWEWWEWLQLFG